MRTRLLLALLLGSLILTGCGGDDSTSPEPPPPPLASATIGADGGEISSDGFSLTVPAGAFASDMTISLYRDEDSDPFGPDAVSDTYRLEGVPTEFSGPLTCRILTTSTKDFSAPMISFGLMGLSPSYGGEYLGWIPTPAVVEADSWWSSTIPVPDAVSRSSKQVSESLVIKVVAAGSHSTLLSGDEHFRIWYPTGEFIPGVIEEFADTFEEAYATYLDFGFGYHRRTVWPFDVVIMDLRANLYGGFWHSPLSENTCIILLNSDYLSDLDSAYATIGHETFHFAQYHCDTREAAIKSDDFGPQYWLDEATAVWAEELFVADENHVSVSRSQLELYPLDSMTPPTGRHAGEHGYGMSSMIKYLVDLHGTDFIGETYDDILTGDAPTIALENNLPSPYADWWGDYLGELISGGIYHDVEVGDLEGYVDEVLEFPNEQFITEIAQLEMVDLSGYLVLTVLGPSFDSDESLLFSLSGTNCTMSLYEVKADSPVYLLQEGVTSYRLDNPDALYASGKNVLALISNFHAVAPDFIATNPATLTVRREEPNFWPTFEMIDIIFNFRGRVAGGDFVGRSVRATAFNTDFDGVTYTASWDTTYAGFRATGDLTLTIDTDTETILSWTVDERDEWSDGTYDYFEMTGEGAVPLEGHYTHPDWMSFRIDGESSCDPVASLYTIYVTGEGETIFELADYECDGMSMLQITLSPIW